MNKIAKKLKNMLLPLVLCLVLMLTGCGRDNNANMSPEGGKDPREGGVLNLAGYIPDTLNPLTTKQNCTGDYLYLAYEGLFIVNENLTVDGVLATGYKALDKNTVFQIKLKEGVRFHDGSAFTSTDVVDTLKYLQYHESRYSNVLENVRTYKATSDYTVDIYLKEPQANFVANLDFPILPSGLKEADFKVPNSSFKINGTGRYKYKNMSFYEGMTLEKNPQWHSSQMVYIPEIYIRFVDNKEAISYAFDAGETDMVTTDYGRWGEYSYGIKYNSHEITTTKYMFVGLNTKSSIFADVNFRKMLATHIDKEYVVDSALFSHAEEADTPITAKAYFYRNDSEKKKSEPTTVKPEEDVTVYVLYNEESHAKENVAKYIKTVLEETGIKSELTKVSYDTYSSKIKSGDYHLYIGEVDMRRDCNLGFLFGTNTVAVPAPKEESAEGEEAEGDEEEESEVQYTTSSRICNFTHENLDDIVNNINSAKDEESAKVAYNNLRVFYEENIPQIPLVHVNDAVFVSKRVMGNLNPNLTSFFADLGDIYLSQKQTK